MSASCLHLEMGGPSRNSCCMGVAAQLRSIIKASRKNGARWVRLLDLLRLTRNAQSRSELWTRLIHGAEVHQTNSHTEPDRYPWLFDQAARMAPHAQRILSFGCSTGEELASLRCRFPNAQIVGAEINPRSRRIAARRLSSDARIRIVEPGSIEGSFDIVFALAVLQRQPFAIAEMAIEDLSAHYPFEQFDCAVRELVARLRPDGLLCVINAHYPIEQSSIAGDLQALESSAKMDEPLFGRDCKRLSAPSARTIFRKRST